MKPTLTTSQQFGNKLSVLLQLGEIDYKEYFILRTNFDNFIESTPLLKHFIACDENGEPIKEPKDYYLYTSSKPYHPSDFFDSEEDFSNWLELCEQFQQVQKQVLFEGFEVKFNNCKEFKYQSETVIIIIDDKLYLEYNCYWKNFIIHFTDARNSFHINTYSDLTKYQLQTNNNFKELIYGK